MVEIVLLALVALFVGLRLVAVLGKRTGHEQQPVMRPDIAAGTDRPALVAEPVAERPESSGLVYDDGAAAGIRAIIAADPSFDVGRFLEGARSAYRMVLEAYWRADEAELAPLVSPEVAAHFAAAIAERATAGHKLDNRLVAIERARIAEARLERRTAFLTVRFDADIAAVTRDSAGEHVAGSMTDAVESHDIWTFRRSLDEAGPDWLLVETDEA